MQQSSCILNIYSTGMVKKYMQNIQDHFLQIMFTTM